MSLFKKRNSKVKSIMNTYKISTFNTDNSHVWLLWGQIIYWLNNVCLFLSLYLHAILLFFLVFHLYFSFRRFFVKHLCRRFGIESYQNVLKEKQEHLKWTELPELATKKVFKFWLRCWIEIFKTLAVNHLLIFVGETIPNLQSPMVLFVFQLKHLL